MLSLQTFRKAAWLVAWLLAISGIMTMSAQAADQKRDPFFWLSEMNKASAVMVVEQGIVPMTSSSPAEFASFIAAEIPRLGRAVKLSGAKVE